MMKISAAGRFSDKVILNTLFNTIGRGWQLVLALLLTPYIVSNIGVGMYGVWALFGVLIGYIGLFDMGISGSFIRYLADAAAQKDDDRFIVGRKTSGRKYRAKLRAMNDWLKTIRCTMPLPQWWRTLVAKLEGHYRYYGVSGNGRSISRYGHWTRKMVYKWVNRRSQKWSYS